MLEEGMPEHVVEIDVGFTPEAAVSGAILLQSEQSTFLIFNAMKFSPATGFYEDAGLAICEFIGCTITKFGYPNDEAWAAIPRTRDLVYCVCEVLDSDWKLQLADLNRFAFPDTSEWGGRHFLILFHDSSFECIAREMRAELTDDRIEDVLSRLSQRIAAE